MSTLLLKIILTFIVGSVWITLTTLSAERIGTKIAGIIAGLPSAIVLSLLFICVTQNNLIAVQSTATIPVAMGASAIFVTAYIFLSKKNFLLGLIYSLLIWFLLAFIIYLIKPDFLISIFGWLLLLGISYYLLEIKSSIQPQLPQKTNYSLPQILFKASFSGALIAMAVLITNLGGPTIGGIFIAFPMMTLPAIIITYFAHGRAFSESFMKMMMLSSSINVVVYVISIRYLLLPLGIFFGTILSILIALLVTGILYFLFYKKQ